MRRSKLPRLGSGGSADVTLLLEGTYPFVSGGVSSWVHQIITGTPERTFAIVFIGGSQSMYDRSRYELPRNVVHLEQHFLDEVPQLSGGRRRREDHAFQDDSRRLHDAFRDPAHPPLDAMLDGLVKALAQNPVAHELDFLYGEHAWNEICERYHHTSKDRSFLEYFWTVRSIHAPLFMLARVARDVPPSRVFHVVSTGFAGFLGTLLQRARRRPLILTEHGIYTKERRIDLMQAAWIKDDEDELAGADKAGIGAFRQLWIHFFETLGRMAYASADPILSLYAGNRERQIRDGADPARTHIVPNGIDIARFAPLREERDPEIPRILALIGRVVPIKDIKTFIRAVRIVCARLPDAEGWVVGPEDEDADYAEECRELVKMQGLERNLKFLGFREVRSVFPKIGLSVLTSISEAQPLVILEGFAAGVPCLTTDVGCCRELIEGVDAEDRALGVAGALVNIADPEATARAAIELLTHPEKWKTAQRAGIRRVERYYADVTMLARYRDIYEDALARSSGEGYTAVPATAEAEIG
jgi:glycosyltransferase involved in cell wall biosynthesis